MLGTAKSVFDSTLAEMRASGRAKVEREITSPQGPEIRVGGRTVLNFSANNYLGFANHPDVVAAAREAMDSHGFGLAAGRHLCGTQDLHLRLERRLAAFLRAEAAIVYSSAFDANGGLFEPLLGEEDAIISDALNHASIIDGVRLCKAARYRYANRDMADLERALREAAKHRIRLVATDGVFSMDGTLAPLDRICDLGERHDALVMVDDSHATGIVGATGRGTPEHFGVEARVDIVTSTLGKALGGASGGFTAGRAEIIELLRQRSRPYIFSNTLPPAVVGASLRVLDLIDENPGARERLHTNATLFRARMTAAGFRIPEGSHPIVPVMLGDARLAAEMSDRLLADGIYAVGFGYPIVPEGQARIRVQLSAAHTDQHLDRAIDAFTRVGRSLGAIR